MTRAPHKAGGVKPFVFKNSTRDCFQQIQSLQNRRPWRLKFDVFDLVHHVTRYLLCICWRFCVIICINLVVLKDLGASRNGASFWCRHPITARWCSLWLYIAVKRLQIADSRDPKLHTRPPVIASLASRLVTWRSPIDWQRIPKALTITQI